MQALRLLIRPFPHASVVPRDRVPRVRSSSFRAVASAPPPAWGWVSGSPDPDINAETARSPRFLGSPCGAAVLSDPGRASASRLRDASVLPTLWTTTPAPTISVVSRLHHTAPPLAVYASRPQSPTDSRKTRFRLLARLYRAGPSPAGLLQKVSVADTSSFSKLGLAHRLTNTSTDTSTRRMACA